MPFLKEWQAGWLAGMIDGEGTICLREAKLKGRSVFQMYVSMTNTHLEALMKVKLFAGCGKLCPKKVKGNQKKAYVWQASGKEALFVLNLVKDYLIIKKEQAVIALEFMEKCYFGRGDFRREQSENKNDLAFNLVCKMQSLNERGVN